MGQNWRGYKAKSFLGFFFFKMGEITGCLYTDRNDVVKRGNLMMH